MDVKNFRLSFKEKVGYGLGDFGCSMYWKLFTMYMTFFYTDVFGITAAAVGTMLLVTRIWDTANDPIMGVIADRTNTRWGKFRPYMVLLSIPFAVMGVLTFTTPDLSTSGKLVYAYVTYTLMMMLYTGVNVPYSSLLGVMSPNSNDRTLLGSYRFIFAFAGSILVLGIAKPLVDFFAEMRGGSQEFGWQMAMVAFGILAIILFALVFSWTRERIEPPKNQQRSLKQDLKDLVHNKPWFILLGAGIFTLIFNSVRDGTIMYYFKYYVEGSSEFNLGIIDKTYPFSSLFMVLGQAGNLIGVLFAGTISERIGKRYTFMYAMGIATALSIVFYFLSPQSYILMFLFQLIISMNAGIIFPLLLSMFGDAADYNEWKQGRRATGLIFSSYSTAQKLGWTLGTAFIGWLLALFGYEANVAQNAETLEGIRAMMSLIPALGAFISGLFIYFYKLDDKVMDQISTELAQSREQD